MSLLLRLVHPLFLLKTADHRGPFLNNVLQLFLLVDFLLLLQLVLLDLHLQSLRVVGVALVLRFLDLVQVRLRVLLALHVFGELDFSLMLLGHLVGHVDFVHVALIDVVLLVFHTPLKLLIAMLVNVERVPVQVCFLPINIGDSGGGCMALRSYAVVEIKVGACLVVS